MMTSPKQPFDALKGLLPYRAKTTMIFTSGHGHALNARNHLIHNAFLTSQAPHFHTPPCCLPSTLEGPITR
ncbi:hypothetical protein [Prevotella sp.]|uniref:hypothetical protein n=1 Tax=Prevotella sp. TaxID=59823 RepID=UPI002F947605